MQIRFANRTLERASRDMKRAKRSWSTVGVAERYIDRFLVLEAVDQFEQLYLFPTSASTRCAETATVSTRSGWSVPGA